MVSIRFALVAADSESLSESDLEVVFVEAWVNFALVALFTEVAKASTTSAAIVFVVVGFF